MPEPNLPETEVSELDGVDNNSTLSLLQAAVAQSPILPTPRLLFLCLAVTLMWAVSGLAPFLTAVPFFLIV